ncbi:MAG: hypothetical protein GTO45_26805 [Candidatus Aminicenantes bacterium]|nr:hypothetical protein [Candidatus Aminicenantes bacterium]NIM82356.1 hypothetical protein [Candidatus Aminicenantes bacterium]NIN21739.1 hypothetical protein [Candidatus Aminicenantes bacterium]NIN45548.1 hypothetical protein [Candidatus Aminicenantes bacterium]NIN88379.1 hypothetical protein [Candidatus Aminicenantes bacterium]
MQTNLNYIWKEVQVLSRSERMKLAERLIHQLRVEDEEQEGLLSWEEMYGIGKGVWEIDAQEYVNQLREERD